MEGCLNVWIVKCLIILLALSESKLTYAHTNGTKPLVPAIYIFGDSGVDPGNNNGLATVVRANFPPYGRDFVANKPTGRFTNGKLATDILSGLAGLPDIVAAFLDPEFQGSRILTGASFASSSSGYADTTSQTVSVLEFMQNVLTLGQQLENFKFYRKQLVNMVGVENASEIISAAMFMINMGTNDFVNNYYLRPITSARYTVTEFQDLLLRSLFEFIQNIFKEGATIFAVISLPPFGCLPAQITLHNLTGNACVEEFNDVAVSFNKRTASLLETIKPRFPGLKIAVINIYDKLLDMIKNPSKYGFEEVRKGCCGTGLLETAILCNPTTPVCPDRSKYVFWDSFHPTSKAYNILAQQIFSQILSILF